MIINQEVTFHGVREPGPVWAKRAYPLSVTEDSPTSSQSLLLPLSEAELRPGGEKVQGAKPKSLGIKQHDRKQTPQGSAHTDTSRR